MTRLSCPTNTAPRTHTHAHTGRLRTLRTCSEHGQGGLPSSQLKKETAVASLQPQWASPQVPRPELSPQGRRDHHLPTRPGPQRPGNMADAPICANTGVRSWKQPQGYPFHPICLGRLRQKGSRVHPGYTPSMWRHQGAGRSEGIPSGEQKPQPGDSGEGRWWEEELLCRGLVSNSRRTPGKWDGPPHR